MSSSSAFVVLVSMRLYLLLLNSEPIEDDGRQITVRPALAIVKARICDLSKKTNEVTVSIKDSRFCLERPF